MKIAQCSAYFPPVEGGLERVVYFLSKALKRRGHDVTVLTSRENLSGETVFPENHTLDGIEVKRMKCYIPRFGFEIPKSIDNGIFEDVDILHIHSHLSPFYIKVLNSAKKMDTPVAMHFMALQTPRKHLNLGVRIFGTLFEELAVNYLKRRVDQPLARSKRDEEILKKDYGLKNTSFLEDGMPAHYFKNYNPEPFFEKYNLKGKNVVFYIGRLHKLKGLHVLVEAAERVVEKHEDTEFLIAGPDDGLKNSLQRKVQKMRLEKNVKILGRISEKEKMRVLSGADMLVLPSLSDIVEVYPMVISEAWSQETPVIGTKIGGIPYRIKDGKNGILVEPNDPKGLSNAIFELLENEKIGEKMGREGSKRVESWDKIAVKAEKIYKDILKNY